MIGVSMLSAALPKAKSGWLDPFLEPCRGQFLLNYIGAERPTRMADAMLTITSPIFWKFLDYSTVLLEGSFVFAMFRLPAMRFRCRLRLPLPRLDLFFDGHLF